MFKRIKFNLFASLALVLSLLLTLTAAHYAFHYFQTAEESHLTEWSQHIEESIDGRIQSYIDTLDATRAFFSISPKVTRESFRHFVKELGLEAKYPGILGVGFVPRVETSDATEHEESVRSAGYPEFRVWPENRVGDRFPVTYIEPFTWKNQRSFGFDMYSEFPMREAMDRARDTGLPVATAMTTLVQDNERNKRPSFLIFAPVYKIDSVLETAQDRRKSLIGFVYLPLRAEGVFREIFGMNFESYMPVDFSVVDQGDNDTSGLLFSSRNQAHSALKEPDTTSPIQVAGRRWTIYFKNHISLASRLVTHFGPFLILAIGIAISFLWWALLSSMKEAATARVSAEKARDIAVRSEKERESLSRRERTASLKFQHLAESLDDGVVWSMDLRMRAFNYASPGAQRVLGMSAAEIENSRDIWIEHGFSDDIATIREKIHQTVSGNQNHVQMNHRFLRPDGEMRWLHTSLAYSPGIDNNEVSELRGLTVDVTEIKRFEQKLSESEERIRQLADAMPQIVWTCKADGTFDYHNKKWQIFSGSAEVEDRENWLEHIHRDDRAQTLRSWRRSIETGKPLQCEHRLLDKNSNTYRWFLTRALPGYSRDGKIMRWYGTSTDIQQQKEIEAELKTAVSLRDEFLSIASHELKTPLTPLRLQIQLAQRMLRLPEKINVEELRTTYGTCIKQIDQLTNLIENLLDVSRIQAGRLDLTHENLDLGNLAREAIDRFSLQSEKAHSPVSLYIDGDIPVHCDRMRMEQVFANLLSNAIKYGGGQPIEVRVHQDSNGAVLSVRDGGKGIDPSMHERIFERFERAVANHDISGLGLGLFIVREIIRAHKGEVRVESDIGRGSLFVVEMPLLIASKDANKPTSNITDDAIDIAIIASST